MNKPVEQANLQIDKEEVQVISSPLKDRAESPALEPSFQPPLVTKSMPENRHPGIMIDS